MNLPIEDVLDVINAVRIYDSTIKRKDRDILKGQAGYSYMGKIGFGFEIQTNIGQNGEIRVTIMKEDGTIIAKTII